LHRRRVGALSSVTLFEQAVLKHPLATPGFFLDGLEFVEEVGPFDDTLFACFEAVGSVEGGGGGGGTRRWAEISVGISYTKWIRGGEGMWLRETYTLGAMCR